MKPIFEVERLFLERELNIEIPTECWKTHTKIYLDYTCKQPIYIIEIVDGTLRLKKDNRNHKELVGVRQKKNNELIKIESVKLEELEKDAFLSVDELEHSHEIELSPIELKEDTLDVVEEEIEDEFEEEEIDFMEGDE